MIAELFSMLSTLESSAKNGRQKFTVNLNRNYIRSISAFSANSIFYFTTVVSDQSTPEEISMVSRMLEKSYASFVVTCISLMPFHRIKADDKASIEEYLAQFHQNLGIDTSSKTGVVFGKVLGLADSLDEAVQIPVTESAKGRVNDKGDDVPETCPKCGSKIGVFLQGEPVYLCTNKKCKKYFGTVPCKNESVDNAMLKQTQDFLLECWEKSRKNCSRYIKIVSETVSLNDMYSIDPVDPVTKVLQESFLKRMDELNTWGFIGEATADMFDVSEEELEALTDEEIVNQMFGYGHHGDDDDDLEDSYPELDGLLDEAGNLKSAINSIMFSLESVSDNKILSCSNLTKLRSLEAKLNKLKNKYAKYLSRYKKQYNENKKNGTKKKLAIRFNGAVINNPKAFMKQYGGYIKIINKRLKLIEKRRAELRKRKGLPADTGKLEESAIMVELSDLDLQTMDRLIETATAQLLAPDSEAFILTEDADDGVDYDQFYNDPIADAEARAKAAEDEAERLRRANEHIRRNAANNARKADAFSRARHQASRYQKMYEDEKKAREKAEKQAGQSQAKKDDRDDPDFQVGDTDFKSTYDKKHPKSGLNVGRYAYGMKKGYIRDQPAHIFGNEVFTNMDMKKANEAIPTFTRATISFVVDETEQIVNRDVLVGIKVQIHKCPAKSLIDDMYNCLINKRRFLKFVKFISGEEKSLADLLFGFKELKLDASSSTGAKRWNSAFRRRGRWSKMSVPYLMKNYTPNGTIVITMNEVQFIKDEYGIDIMLPEHVRMLMDAEFLLGFVVLDQSNEMCYVSYDGSNGEFQEYTYAMLEREQQTTDRMLRELYRSMSR